MNNLVSTNLVNPLEVERKVKKMYRKVALHPEVAYHFEMGRELAERLGYPSDLLDQIPQESIDSFAGVGYYFDLANLKEGENVLDLGSGSGMDVFFAANQVGATGKVIGIDMTPEQLEKSELLRQEFGYWRVNFLNSYIEKLPLADETFDAVISNGVVNLSSQKGKVFQEASRVLKPGGKLVLADIVTTTRLSPSIKNNSTLWAACIGGAIPESNYLRIIEKAGLKVKNVKLNPYRFLSKGAQQASKGYGIKSISLVAEKQ